MPAKRGRTSTRSGSRRRVVSRSSSSRRSASNMAATGGESLVSARNHRAQWNSAPGWSLRSFDPFPARMRAKLRYNEVIAMDSAAGAPAHYFFRANSIYDPNYTGVGHSPLGADQYEALYHHYKVVSCVCSITPTSAFNSSFGICLTADTTGPTGYYDITEQKGTKWAMNSSSSTVPTVTNYYNKNYFPNSDSVDVGALMGTNPNEVIYFDCFTKGETASTEDTSKNFAVCMEYIVDFWELKVLPQS